MTDIADYTIDHSGYDWAKLLQNWGWLLTEEFSVWMMTRFGDLFLVMADGSIRFLNTGTGTAETVAGDATAFADQLDAPENFGNWFYPSLIAELEAYGKRLGPNTCYALTQPAVVGGTYTADNIEIIDISEFYSILGQVHDQIKDLPPGAPIELDIEG